MKRWRILAWLWGPVGGGALGWYWWPNTPPPWAWLVLVATGSLWGLPDVAHDLREVLGRSRKRRGLCSNCGYSLAGNVSGVCPECGTPVAR
jgi:hypothetical protein